MRVAATRCERLRTDANGHEPGTLAGATQRQIASVRIRGGRIPNQTVTMYQ